MAAEAFPAVPVTKPARPGSAPGPKISRFIVTGPPKSANSKHVGTLQAHTASRPHRRSVGAHEASQRKLDQTPGFIRPVVRARSGVTPNPDRSRSHKARTHQDQSYDAVIRRLFAEVNGDHLRLPGDAPPVPALPAFVSGEMGRPHSYQPGSSRSSMTKRRSPLSVVSSAGGNDSEESSAQTSRHTSRHTSRCTSTSASSQTSKSDGGNDLNDGDDDANEKIRLVNLAAYKPGHVQQQHKHTPQPLSCSTPSISHSKPQPAKRRSPWQTLSPRRILCFV